MSIRCVIVDDEKLAREALQILLKRCDALELDVIGEAGNVDDAIKLVKAGKPDLLFLDISMPEQNGFAMFQQVAREDMPFVVFVTAYNEFAIDAFDADAVDYLLKPVSEERLRESLCRVRSRIEQKDASERNRAMRRVASKGVQNAGVAVKRILLNPKPSSPLSLRIRDGGDRVRVDVNDIVCVEAAGDYLCIKTPRNSYIHRGTLKELIPSLNPEQFYRVHRSSVVNVDFVVEVRSRSNGCHELKMADSTIVRSSKTHQTSIKRIRESLMR